MGFLSKIVATVMPNTARANYINTVLPGVEMTPKRMRAMRTSFRAQSEGLTNVRDGNGRIVTFNQADGPRAWITRDISNLRFEGRMIARNNPYARFAVHTLNNWVIADGINITFKVPAPAEPAKDTAKARKAKAEADAAMEATTKAVNNVLKRWAYTTQCDAHRRYNIHGLMRLIYQTKLESGEVIIRLRPRKSSDGLALPLAIEVLEPDYFWDGPEPREVKAGNSYANGMEFSPVGHVEVVYLYKSHPLDGGPGALSYVRVPVYDQWGNQQIIHYFDKQRPGQHRGVPRGAIVYQTLLKKYDLDQSLLNRRRVEAKIQHFVEIGHDADPDDQPRRNSHVEEIDEDSGYISSPAHASQGVMGPLSREEMQDWLDDAMQAIVDDNSVVPMPPGTKYKPQVIANFTDLPSFSEGLMNEVAVGFFAPDWLITGNMKKLSFAGGELGLLSFRASCTSEQDDFAVTVLEPIFKMVTFVGNRAALWRDPEIDWDFLPQRFPERDPNKAAQAAIALVNAGFSSRRRETTKMGMRWEEVEQEIEEEVEWARKRGLPLEPGLYARTASGSAGVQARAAQEADEDDEDGQAPVE